MIIGFPTMGDEGLDEEISPHFGRGATFTLYDTEDGSVDIISNRSRHTGGRANPPELLAEEDVDIMVCSDLGKKAVSLFDQLGIEVYSGAEGCVKDALEGLKEGRLQETKLDDACSDGRRYQR